MSNVQWELEIPLTNENVIELFEIESMYQIGDDFKQFFKQYNAGIPTKNTITLKNGTEKVVDSLLSFNKEDDETVHDYANYFKGVVKLEKLPFAKDPFGNLFCLHDEKVLYWEQETEEFYLVSESFNEFLNSLK